MDNIKQSPTVAVSSDSNDSLTQKDIVKQRIKQEQASMKVHEADGEYKFDNKDLEYKTKRITRMVDLEDKYKDKPKIAFHELSEEGNKLFMQAKRDRVWNTLGWSLIGNVAGIGVVQFYDARPLKRWAAPRFYR